MYVPRDATVAADRAAQRRLGRPRPAEHRQRDPDDHRRPSCRPRPARPARRRRPGRSSSRLRRLALAGRRRHPPRLVLPALRRLRRRRLRDNADGETVPRPIGFLQESPFNNMWLMVILIWIQTGFAMVILSAAIKAVPDEIIEAARVDGATTVADLLAGHAAADRHHHRRRRDDAHRPRHEGVRHRQGRRPTATSTPRCWPTTCTTRRSRPATSAGARRWRSILFVSVLPVMIYNIRRMQREN